MAHNTRRMNRLEELGRVDAERADTSLGKGNLKAEKRRIVDELRGYKTGGSVGTTMYSRGYGVDKKSRRTPTKIS